MEAPLIIREPQELLVTTVHIYEARFLRITSITASTLRSQRMSSSELSKALLTLLWGDLLLAGHRLCNTLVWGQQCCTTCVALQLLGANYSSQHPNLSKHDGSCSFATAAGPH